MLLERIQQVCAMIKIMCIDMNYDVCGRMFISYIVVSEIVVFTDPANHPVTILIYIYINIEDLII